MNDRRIIARRALLLVPFLLAGVSCTLFDTREPEPPSQAGSDFTPPNLPSDVISNLKNAIAQKNALNYMRSFADTTTIDEMFRFSPSATARTAYPGVFDDWDRIKEENHIKDLISHRPTLASYSNLITSGDQYIPQGDATIFTSGYTFSFDTDDPAFPSTARGRLQFIIKR
ncbi:MAG: hypothetical protein OEM41_05715, partial [Ignavibacteria bacterium]|nr:hypothetical protein [Ignavibacteria bacterium]